MTRYFWVKFMTDWRAATVSNYDGDWETWYLDGNEHIFTRLEFDEIGPEIIRPEGLKDA